ncbi:MAG: hypothetical protein ACM3PA_00330 [Methanomassiliicoccales archaeon]
MAKVIRFPVERRENYTGFEKDRWFRESVNEILIGIEAFFDNYDIFSGRYKKAKDKD